MQHVSDISGHQWKEKSSNGKLKVLIEEKVVTLNQIKKKKSTPRWLCQWSSFSYHRKQCSQQAFEGSKKPNVQAMDLNKINHQNSFTNCMLSSVSPHYACQRDVFPSFPHGEGLYLQDHRAAFIVLAESSVQKGKFCVHSGLGKNCYQSDETK